MSKERKNKTELVVIYNPFELYGKNCIIENKPVYLKGCSLVQINKSFDKRISRFIMTSGALFLFSILISFIILFLPINPIFIMINLYFFLGIPTFIFPLLLWIFQTNKIESDSLFIRNLNLIETVEFIFPGLASMRKSIGWNPLEFGGQSNFLRPFFIAIALIFLAYAIPYIVWSQSFDSIGLAAKFLFWACVPVGSAPAFLLAIMEIFSSFSRLRWRSLLS